MQPHFLPNISQLATTVLLFSLSSSLEQVLLGIIMWYKTGVINDPTIGQIHSFASSEYCFHFFVLLEFEKWGRTDGRTTYAKTMIPTGRDCGLAEWIKRHVAYTINKASVSLFVYSSWCHHRKWPFGCPFVRQTRNNSKKLLLWDLLFAPQYSEETWAHKKVFYCRT